MDEESKSVTASFPDDTGEIMQLDPEGDAVLIIKDSGCTKRYLVSSRVLSLASPVLSKLFGPNFKEGQETRRGDRPSISLEEDDPTAMGLILSILHYKCANVMFAMEPTALATLAIHCDKYDCIEALMPWSAHWCSNSEGITSPEDLGSMVLAAYMFRSSSFSKVTATAVKQLTPSFVSVWEKHEALALLPEAVTAALSDQIADGLNKLRQEVNYTERRLRGDESQYTMRGWVCMSCHIDLLSYEAKSLHRSHDDFMFARTCTSDHRVAEYFNILTRCDLWPSIEPFATQAISDIMSRVRSAQKDQEHECGASGDCPLRRELEVFSVRAQGISERVKGISLKEIGVNQIQGGEL